MKRRVLRLLPLLLMLVAQVTMAETVDRGRARQAATTFLSNNGAQTTGLTDVTSATGFSNVYVFTTENSFVLMAADDRVQPILGYSLNGRFDIENMPDNKRAWIEGYTHEIQYAIDHQTRATSEVSQQWRDLVEGRPDAGRTTTVVTPLVQTKWDQTSPYNLLCPGGSVTGCVATAMAQIMKYWNYPSHGIGSHSYNHASYGVLSADFQSTTYDWNNMTNTYSSSSTSAQKMAVATLMYHCGVSVNMNYSPNGSGAGSAIVAESLKNYFNYSLETVYHDRSEYGDNTWIGMLKTELDLGRPVYYCGSGSGGGHAFVFDGYNSSNNFHVNWGWSGYCDEYYSINNLNPGPGGTGSGTYGIYNDNQGAVIGIRPSECTANAPTNLTYTQNGRNVTLSWSAATGASSYKVYCNNNFVGDASTNSYTDTAPYGSLVYYVRSVDSQGRLSLSSNAVTVTVAYPTPVVDDLSATVSGKNVTLSWTAPDWCYPETPSATLSYGEGNIRYSWTSTYYAHRYLAADLAQYANKAVYKVATYVQYPGTYSAYVYTNSTSNNQPSANSCAMSKVGIEVSTTGWFEFEADEPIILSSGHDLWVVMKQENTGQTYPTPSFDLSSHNTNAFYASNSSPTSLYDANSSYNCAWLIKAYITDADYTYNVYRNGTCIANSVNGTYFNDTNLADGTYSYYLKTNYYGGVTEASNQVSVEIISFPGDGTEQNPYIITTTAQLDALASAVNGGETYNGTYFILGNDIAYSTEGLGDTDENFTTIGGYFEGLGGKNFSGTFDGQGHTISGIRLYKTGTDAQSMYQGLFGRISGATIKNLILADASITGYRYVGGLVGNKVNGTVQNCLVFESTITCADKYVGALFGKDTGTVNANHYRNCTVNGMANATNVGAGGNGGVSSSRDKNGARSVHTLTLGENITAAGESVTYQGITYYASNTTITLGHDLSSYVATYYVDGAAIAGNTFTMPAEDVSVTATWIPDPTHFEQTGTDEYTIYTATGWDLFCDAMQDNDTYGRFVGKTVKLGADISVTRMAGGSGHEFGGTFEGQGHTLTVSYQNNNGTVRTAPFTYVDGATIQNLIVAGNITGTASRAAGIVGETGSSLSHVTNCVSSVNVSGGNYTGGISVGGNVEITGCVFNGTITGTNMSGGLVGWSTSALVIRDCLFAPQDGSTITGGTFYYNGGGEITPVNSYYTVLLGTEQGLPAISDPAIQPIGDPTGTYPLSNLTAYVNGLMYGDIFYYNPSIVAQTVTLTEGWNYVSMYVDMNQVDGMAMLKEALGDYGVTIVTFDDQAEYLGDGFWLGLEDYQLTNGEMILIEVSEDCTLTLEGPVVDPSTVEITINPEWNYIGYPLAVEMTVEEAMSAFEAEFGDGIANFEGLTEYLGEWMGDFETLVPGQGYMYYSYSDVPKTLVFSPGSKARTKGAFPKAKPQLVKPDNRIKE